MDESINGVVTKPENYDEFVISCKCCKNVYTKTINRKFVYADDITLAYRCKTFEEAEVKPWRLKLNLSITEVSAIHLNNQMANKELNIRLNNVVLNHNFNPKMLGTTEPIRFKLVSSDS